MNALRTVIVPVNPDGWLFVGIFAIASLILFALWEPLGWVGVVLTAWCVYFFRDPDRVVPQTEGLVLSPGDGVISAITDAPPPPELEMGEEPRVRISVFLNVFNVHVNRVPVAGEVRKLHYHAGKFFNAALDKASEHNERQSICITTAKGKDVACVQIAGLVARRIICRLKEGQHVVGGARFGHIRFGSRVDVYLPPGVAPSVAVGQLAIGGETILANLHASENIVHETIAL